MLKWTPKSKWFTQWVRLDGGTPKTAGFFFWDSFRIAPQKSAFTKNTAPVETCFNTNQRAHPALIMQGTHEEQRGGPSHIVWPERHMQPAAETDAHTRTPNVCLSACLPVCLTACSPSLSLPVYVYVCVCVCVSASVSLRPSLSVCLSLCVCVSLSLSLSVSVCLSVVQLSHNQTLVLKWSIPKLI